MLKFEYNTAFKIGRACLKKTLFSFNTPCQEKDVLYLMYLAIMH